MLALTIAKDLSHSASKFQPAAAKTTCERGFSAAEARSARNSANEGWSNAIQEETTFARSDAG